MNRICMRKLHKFSNKIINVGILNFILDEGMEMEELMA